MSWKETISQNRAHTSNRACEPRMKVGGIWCNSFRNTDGTTRAFTMGSTVDRTKNPNFIVKRVHARPNMSFAVSQTNQVFRIGRGFDMLDAVYDNTINMCPDVPCLEFQGCILSRGYNLFMQRVQLGRHLSWWLCARYKAANGRGVSKATAKMFAKKAQAHFTEDVKRRWGIDLDNFEPTELDGVMTDDFELVRDFVRRYGAEFRNR